MQLTMRYKIKQEAHCAEREYGPSVQAYARRVCLCKMSKCVPGVLCSSVLTLAGFYKRALMMKLRVPIAKLLEEASSLCPLSSL